MRRAKKIKFTRMKKNPQVKYPKYQKQKFFKLLVEGKFTPDRVEMKETPGSLKRSPESEAILESGWQKLLKSGFKPWPNDTKPSRYYFAGAKVENDKLVIAVDPSLSYRDAIGARNPELKKLGKEYLPIWIGSNLIILAKNKSGEEMIGITLRNSNHDYKPNGYHVTAGGAMDATRKERAIETALREAKEEIGINPKEFSKIICNSVIFNPWSVNAIVNFIGIPYLSVEEILARNHDDENEIIFISADKQELQKWLLKTSHANSSDGIAALLLIGKDRYGEKWFEEMSTALSLLSSEYDDEQKRKELEQRDIRRIREFIKKS